MKKLLFIISAAIAVNCSAQEAGHERPNIIFIFPDDHALQAISAYGSKINKTPNIDRLAEQGMIFRNAMVTNSICAQSRAAILTGQYAFKNGMRNNHTKFYSTRTTYPKILHNAGYQTALIAKWHLKSQPTGFDCWKLLPGQGQYYNPTFITPNGKERQHGYVTDLITDEALDWFKTRRRDNKPFLLLYQQKAPHSKWIPGPGYLNKYNRKKIPEPATLFDDHQNRASGVRNQTMEIGDNLEPVFALKLFELIDSTRLGTYGNNAKVYARMTPEQRWKLYSAYKEENKTYLNHDLKGKAKTKWKYQRFIKDYLRTVASLDDNIERFLDHLDELGLRKNTIVVYCSDQGFFLGKHEWFDKRWMYEETLHLPFIIRWLGVIKTGSENDDSVLNIDFAETFLDDAGVRIPERMQGKSLLPLLKGNTPDDWRKSVYYHYIESGPFNVLKHFGIRTDRLL